jgi:hypothetical protein
MSLPEAFTHQDELLTVDTSIGKFLEGLLHPGIKEQGLTKMNYISAQIPKYTR